MGSSECHCVTKWCFTAQINEVCGILADVESVPTWWQSVYLEASLLDPGDDRGVGRRLSIVSRGPLLHCFKWEYLVVESRHPHGFCFHASGELIGKAEWSLHQNGEIAYAELDWQISPSQAVLNLLKPAVRWNHEAAMREGQRCLCAELKRRRRQAAAV